MSNNSQPTFVIHFSLINKLQLLKLSCWHILYTTCGLTIHVLDYSDIIRNAVNASEHDSVIFCGNGCTGAVYKLVHSLNLKSTGDQRPVCGNGKHKCQSDNYVDTYNVKYEICSESACQLDMRVIVFLKHDCIYLHASTVAFYWPVYVWRYIFATCGWSWLNVVFGCIDISMDWWRLFGVLW